MPVAVHAVVVGGGGGNANPAIDVVFLVLILAHALHTLPFGSSEYHVRYRLALAAGKL